MFQHLNYPQNGEAAPEYQSLLIELEAIQRALGRLHTLRPAKHELVQLMSIQATALACQKPLQEFLEKISKFESRLGTFHSANNKWKGLPRRMQFRTMYKDDVEQLRLALASHMSTINLLLMTQAVASITIAEDDRERLASGLESRILAQRRLLKQINGHAMASVVQLKETRTELEDQSYLLKDLGGKADETCGRLIEQEQQIGHIRAATDHIRHRSNSILATVTEVLTLVTAGLMHLRDITQQLHKMIQVCVTFTEEMRTTMAKLVQLFTALQPVLQRIDNNLATRLYLPTVQFTTALGEKMALPFQLCQQWTTFTELVKVIFLDKPGQFRVDMGSFIIQNAHGRILDKESWQHAVQQDDHLSMSLVLDNLTSNDDICPFTACGGTLGDVETESGGQTCRKCARWTKWFPIGEADCDMISVTRLSCSDSQQCVEAKADLELYHRVHVKEFTACRNES